MTKQQTGGEPIKAGVARLVPVFWAVGLFSLGINILMLTAPLYMLQVYDRVLTSGSRETLLLLTLVSVFALLVLAGLDWLRGRLLVRAGNRLDHEVAEPLFGQLMQSGRSSRTLRDLDTVRSFLSGQAPTALFDAPWIPVFIGVIYLLHPYLGHIAVGGGLILLLLAISNDVLTRKSLAQSSNALASANQFAEQSARNRDAIQAMGMLPGLTRRWRQNHILGLGFQTTAGDRGSGISAAAKLIRFLLQLSVLGVGAYLAIDQVITPGTMIAASIIMARALAPIEMSIQGWRGFVRAREGYGRLKSLLADVTAPEDAVPLPRPEGRLAFENVYAHVPEREGPILKGVNFTLAPGEVMGLTGPSGAGKSTLARLAVGAAPPSSGHVRLDEAEIVNWAAEDRGPYIGYLPQDIELFDATVAENIARFRDVDSEQIIAAAKMADAETLIMRLPENYSTRVGPAGQNLSGGQRQRLALARAVLDTPSLVVLDEPTSNLDAEGEQAFRQTIDRLKAAGTTVVIIAHRPSLLANTDKLMVLIDGEVSQFGPTEEVMPSITRRVVREQRPAQAV